MSDLTIGALARGAGVGVETVRYYQRRGLMPQPTRRPRQIRRYGRADLERLRFIRAAKNLGFSLGEIAELLRLESGGSCDEVKRLAQARLEDIALQIAGLRKTQEVLSEFVRRCDTSGGTLRCPLIASLEQLSSVHP